MGETRVQHGGFQLVEEFGINREHAEFHNAYRTERHQERHPVSQGRSTGTG